MQCVQKLLGIFSHAVCMNRISGLTYDDIQNHSFLHIYYMMQKRNTAPDVHAQTIKRRRCAVIISVVCLEDFSINVCIKYAMACNFPARQKRIVLILCIVPMMALHRSLVLPFGSCARYAVVRRVLQGAFSVANNNKITYQA